ncbi:MAG: NAD(P)H-binding protein [Acidobacteria bacterium]|nr:NAD(P)H-binding protein [Acidobacteriota bacterium]MBI3472479.1 NAD(P)H-binding protein [Candidatus Solibacter usitatus]
MGCRLIPRLLDRGHQVRALARTGSQHKLPSGCQPVIGDALDAATYAGYVPPCETFVHLVGVAHPSPAKASQFHSIDLASIQAAVRAASAARIQHFVYVSVGQPAPVMKAYVAVRGEGEALIRQAGLNATILRPWYVLGPGHRWPAVLRPVYWLAECFPASRDSARRLGLVTLDQMLGALVRAVEEPAQGIRVLEVPQITSWAHPAP